MLTWVRLADGISDALRARSLKAMFLFYLFESIAIGAVIVLLKHRYGAAVSDEDITAGIAMFVIAQWLAFAPRRTPLWRVRQRRLKT